MSKHPSAHEIVRSFKKKNVVDEADFQEWFRDAGFSQEMADVHDSRHLAILENYVEQRDEQASWERSSGM